MSYAEIKDEVIANQEKINDIIKMLIKRNPDVIAATSRLLATILKKTKDNDVNYPRTKARDYSVFKFYAGLEQSLGVVVLGDFMADRLDKENMNAISLGRKLFNETVSIQSTDEILGQMALIKTSEMFYIFAYLSDDTSSDIYIERT